VIPVADHARLVELSGGDPWVRFGLDPAAVPPAWHDAGTGLLVIGRSSGAHGTSLVLLPGPASGAGAGPDADRALAATVALARRQRTRWLTAPRAWSGQVRDRLAPPGPGVGWDWMWTDRPPGPPGLPPDPQVTDLDGTDPATIAELRRLLRHSPRHTAVPGAPDVAGWVGVRASGRLVACAAWVEPVPGVPLLASVAVHRDARRHGLAAAVTTTIARRALAAGAPAVTVDLYADNDAARRVYRRLGFRTGHEFASWPLPTSGPTVAG
jgi:GNAT superfamily N-acetyltransferase